WSSDVCSSDLADPALPRVVVEEPGVHEDRVRAAEDQPDVVVERDRLVRRLAVEELAGRRIPLPVLERVDFVHGSPRVVVLRPARLYGKLWQRIPEAGGVGGS